MVWWAWKYYSSSKDVIRKNYKITHHAILELRNKIYHYCNGDLVIVVKHGYSGGLKTSEFRSSTQICRRIREELRSLPPSICSM
jgi:hypothetical protein